MDALDLIAKIKMDLSEYDEGLDKAKSKAESSGSSMSSAFGKVASGVGKAMSTITKVTAAAVGAAATGVAALTKSAVENYAEYEQLVGGVETLFGTQGMTLEEYANSVGASVDEIRSEYESLESAQATVMKNASEAYKTAGLSANEYMEQATSTAAALVSSLGGDTEEAAALADQAIIDMSDNANKMGTDIESIQNAYNGFAKGNFTMLDNLKLGYGGTKEEMERLLEDAEAISGVEYSTDSYADIVEAIHVVQEEMGVAGTTAREAEETISGSVSMVKASWSNLLTGLADENADIEGLIDEFVGSVSIAAGNILPIVNTALTGVGTLIDELVPKIMDQIPSLINDVLPSLVESGISVIQSILNGMEQNSGMITDSVLEIANMLIESFTTMLPQLLSIGLQIIEQLATGVGESLPELIPTIVDIVLQMVNTLIEHVPDLIEAGLTIFLGLVEGLVEAIPVIINALPELISNIIDALTEAIPLIMEAGTELFLALVDALPDIIDALADALPQIIDSIVEFFAGDGFTSLIDASIQMFMAIIDAIPQIVTSLTGAMPQIINSIVTSLVNNAPAILSASVTTFTSLITGFADVGIELLSTIADMAVDWIDSVLDTVDSWVQAGKDLITGLWNGFKSMIGTVTEGISSWATGIINAVKSKFGISSPSKVFAEIGAYMAEGLGVGWDEEISDINKQIDNDLKYEGEMDVSANYKGLTTEIANANTGIVASSNRDTDEPIIINVYTSLDGKIIGQESYQYTKEQINNDNRALTLAQGGYY